MISTKYVDLNPKEPNYGNFKLTNELVDQGTKVYFYMLTYRGQYSFTDLYGLPDYGVSHADDLFYLFNPLFGLPPLQLNGKHFYILIKGQYSYLSNI